MRLAPARRFRGRFGLPGDKSLSHRLALLAAAAEGESRFENFSTAADCASTLACLEALGVAARQRDRSVLVHGRGWEGLSRPTAPLDAGNSGSTLRMLAGLLAGRPFRCVLTGDASLLSRPVERVAAPLRAMGAKAETTDGHPPLSLEGGRLRSIDWTLPVASAQVKTAVLLAGLQAQGRTTVTEPGASRDHTERLLPLFGVAPQREGLATSVEGGARLQAASWSVPGDVSSAAFLVVAALILPDSAVRIDDVLLNPQRTAFLAVLEAMGARIRTGIAQAEPEPVGFIEAESSLLHGTTVAAERVPALIDEVPALAVAGAHAEGRFTLSGAAELRVKESDRIAALAEGLRAMGARIEERPDGFVIEGGRRLGGAPLRSRGDHRIAMALAVAALAAQGDSELDGAECAAVSFPEFFEVLGSATRG